MFIFAHLAAGLIVGKSFENYTPALIGALVPDLDHIIPYIQHGIFFSPRKFWKTATNPKDRYGNQRNYLHNIIVWAIISVPVIMFDFKIGIVFSLAYLSHLFLDLLDSSDFRPLYPMKFSIKGPIGYLSKSESFITLILFLIFFVL